VFDVVFAVIVSISQQNNREVLNNVSMLSTKIKTRRGIQNFVDGHKSLDL
jgi:hypothetical protein